MVTAPARRELVRFMREKGLSEPPSASSALGQAAANGWATSDEVTSLSCANSDIVDVAGLESLDNLETLDLTGNTDILCSDLDALETALPSTTITRPASCNTGSGFFCGYTI